MATKKKKKTARSQTALALLALIKPPLYKVPVPPWGDEAHVWVRSLTDDERRKHIKEAQKNITEDPTKESVEDGIRNLVILYSSTEDGEPLFDEDNIGQVTWDGVVHIYYAMTRIWNGLHDYESAKKN